MSDLPEMGTSMKLTVTTYDNLDTRKELILSLLPALSPVRRVEFLQWAIDLGKIIALQNVKTLTHAKPDHAKMWPMILAATNRDEAADYALTKEIYGDLCALWHNWQVELLPVLEELERWAKGREVTPPPTAARDWIQRVIRTAGNRMLSLSAV